MKKLKTISKSIILANIALTFGFLTLGTVFTQRVEAAYPGQNGKIVFTTIRDGNFELYTMNIDGTSTVRLTNNSFNDTYPAFSPDGTRVVFISNRDGNDEVYTMNADGTNQTRLTNDTTSDAFTKWSPDGTKIVFQSSRDGNAEVYTMNADGTNQTRLTNNTASDSNPAWSPDGTKIAFSTNRDGNNEIYVMNADGTNQTRITNNATTDSRPAYSPDGTKIAFLATRDGNNEIYTLNIDGTNPIRLTNNLVSDDYPDWSPDGTKIVFDSSSSGNREVTLMNTDGSNQVNLSNNAATDTHPSFQPLTIPPNATNDPNVTTTVGKAVTINVLANDTDTYGSPDPSSVTVTVAPANGATSVNTTNGQITYTPNAGFSGSDSFTYRVCSSESASLCDTATVTITVAASSVVPGLPKTGNANGNANYIQGLTAIACSIFICSLVLRQIKCFRKYKN